MLIAPLLPYLPPSSIPTVFGISGYSGAGTIVVSSPEGEPITTPKIGPLELKGGVKAYSVTDHIHEREAGWHLSKLLSTATDSGVAGAEGIWSKQSGGGANFKVAFIPHIAPWFSGILCTLSVPLSSTSLSAKDIQALYASHYANEKLVRLKNDWKVVELSDVQGKQGWVVGGWGVHSEGGRVVVTAGLDNLLKGAATQCLQVSIFDMTVQESC
jgi:N-acetyl-gamma-glutamyl-phosphate reductase/acetylglutamate kinase